MNPVVLITGADGFVGRNLVNRLLRLNFEVRMVVRRKSLTDHCIAVGDIGPDTFWRKALAGVSMVVHLAARVHVMKDTSTDPLAEFRQVNVLGTERLAIEAARAGVRRFIYMSSVKVNGDNTAIRSRGFTEKSIPNPQDSYGLSKWEAEQVLFHIAQETGLEVTILRPPLIYGPEVRANFLKLLRVVDLGIPMPFGGISNRRSLVYIGNLVDATITCLKCSTSAGQTYMVSDGMDVSTPELIRGIAYALDRTARVFSFPSALLHLFGKISGRPETITRLLDSLVIDSSKIRQELDWRPPYSMNQGLQETVKWYKDRNGL